MQIFSKLQRNSTYYLFIKAFVYFLALLLNSEFVFFPLLVGFVAYSESLLFSVLYFSLFAVFHQITFIKAVYFVLFLIFFNYYLKDKIADYVNETYQPVVGIFAVYLFFLPVVGFNMFNVYFLIYNMAVDIIIFKLYRK